MELISGMFVVVLVIFLLCHYMSVSIGVGMVPA